MKLDRANIDSVVNYIGGKDGYLCEFTQAGLETFYSDYCGLEYDVYEFDGDTTRKRFITILATVSPQEQRKILVGVTKKIPFEGFDNDFRFGRLSEEHYIQKRRLYEKICLWIDQFAQDDLVGIQNQVYDLELVRKTLEHCETLIRNHEYSSAIDRAHTALHSYLKEVCNKSDIGLNKEDPRIQELWSKIREQHPSFKDDRSDYKGLINKINNGISKILDVINEIRNNHSFAHPNSSILENNEALLVINLTRSFICYVEGKINT